MFFYRSIKISNGFHAAIKRPYLTIRQRSVKAPSISISASKTRFKQFFETHDKNKSTKCANSSVKWSRIFNQYKRSNSFIKRSRSSFVGVSALYSNSNQCKRSNSFIKHDRNTVFLILIVAYKMTDVRARRRLNQVHQNDQNSFVQISTSYLSIKQMEWCKSEPISNDQTAQSKTA